jgi:hypothetical protein
LQLPVVRVSPVECQLLQDGETATLNMVNFASGNGRSPAAPETSAQALRPTAAEHAAMRVGLMDIMSVLTFDQELADDDGRSEGRIRAVGLALMEATEALNGACNA